MVPKVQEQKTATECTDTEMNDREEGEIELAVVNEESTTTATRKVGSTGTENTTGDRQIMNKYEDMQHNQTT